MIYAWQKLLMTEKTKDVSEFANLTQKDGKAIISLKKKENTLEKKTISFLFLLFFQQNVFFIGVLCSHTERADKKYLCLISFDFLPNTGVFYGKYSNVLFSVSGNSRQ